VTFSGILSPQCWTKCKD